MNEVHRDTLVEFLKHRKACDLCLKEKCNKRCKHARNYTYGYMEKLYDKAIEAAGNDVATALAIANNYSTAEVAEVVRCKDCKYHHWEQEPERGKTEHFCSILKSQVFKEFYCYHGTPR